MARIGDADGDGNAGQTGGVGRPQPTLARDQPEAWTGRIVVLLRSDPNRLQDASGFHRFDQGGELAILEKGARIESRLDVDPIQRQVSELSVHRRERRGGGSHGGANGRGWIGYGGIHGRGSGWVGPFEHPMRG